MPAYKDGTKGTWYASFYYRDFTGQNKKKCKRGFQRKRDAEAWEREFLNTQNGSSNMKLSSLCSLYIEDSQSRLKASTMQTKKNIINKWIVPKLGEIPINQLTAVQIRQWQGYLINETDLSETFIKTIHNQMSAICNYGVSYYGMKNNPARQAGAVGKKYADEMSIWTAEEFQAVLDEVSDAGAKIGLLVLFWTGLRIGELTALTLNDIDLVNGILSISKTLNHINGEDIITTPKTSKSRRMVPIPPKVNEELKEYISKQYGLRKHDRVFFHHKSHYHRHMEKACKELGIKKIRLHDLRHSHASLLIHQNVPILLVSQRLGHEDIQTTLRTYAHLYPNTTDETMQLLNSLIK